MINIRSFSLIFIYTLIGTLLSNEYTKTIADNYDGMTDAVWYIEIANKIKDYDFPIIPFYYSRSLLYFLIDITAFPPTILQIILFNFMNGTIIYILVDKIVNSLSKDNANVIIVLYFLSPGALFLTVTFRTEWPGYLAIYFYVIYINSQTSFVKGFISSFFVRASGPPTAFLIYLNKSYLNPNVDIYSTLKLFIKLNVIFGVLLYIINEWVFNYYDSPWYLFTIYNDELRDSLNIHSNNQIYLLPFKIIISYILDGFSLNAIINAFESPENLNNIAASIRVLIILIILFKIISNNFNYFYLLNYYILTTIPNIAMIGFYQTRYLIVQDIFLYIAVLGKSYK